MLCYREAGGGTPSGAQHRAHIARTGGRLFPPLFFHLHFATLVTFFGAGSVVGGEWGPQDKVYFWCLSTLQVGALCPNKEVCVGCFGGGLVPQEGTVRWLFWWGHVPQEQVFASQGFFVVPKTEQGTSIIPLGVRHHLGGWGLGHRALFVVPGRAHWGSP